MRAKMIRETMETLRFFLSLENFPQATKAIQLCANNVMETKFRGSFQEIKIIPIPKLRKKKKCGSLFMVPCLRNRKRKKTSARLSPINPFGRSIP
tara:strand:+ start:154844 stop:155128 length:285 start_codon:yes stop_codon:yes gene_type:complete